LLALAAVCFWQTACRVPALSDKTPNTRTPDSYGQPQDSSNAASLSWRDYFRDPNLVALIDTALQHNQELAITLQEIAITQNEVKARRAEYLPFVGVRAGAGLDKTPRYTPAGTLEKNLEIAPGKENPELLPDLMGGLYASWEADIWHKLHNARKAAAARYLSSIEGRNFVITSLISEIANSYYELVALDNQLEIVRQNIEIQQHALDIVKLQKASSRVTELAVKKFEAEVLNTQSLQYGIQQQIRETENRINFLLGRYPQPIPRDDKALTGAMPAAIQSGLPSQLLANRPDIRQAELELSASRLDVQVARAQFFPSVGITAGLGYQAFNPAYLLRTPESMLFSLAGELAAPLVNRAGIKAAYANANARQVQAATHYEQTILKAYLEVANQLSKIGNLEKSYTLKAQEVAALTESITISNDLFSSTRADYMEVLMTQRDALESKFELIETRKEQLAAMVNIYQALGGGWR
jgi:NodT family efflux transporter outer membrane factor (OMF) lipoprotein